MGLVETIKKLFSPKGKKSLPDHEKNPPCCREGDTLFDPSAPGGKGGFGNYSSPCSER